MSATIHTEQIGLSVFGQAQVAYRVDGKTGRSFDEAITAAGFSRTASLESAIPAYEAAIRKRQVKLRELGEALAEIAKVAVSFDSDDELDDTKSLSAATTDTLKRYGIDGASDGKVSKADVQKVQADAQFAIDLENNSVQQDLATFQGLMNKRDNAYATIAKIVQKAIKTETTGIRYIQ